MRELPPSCPLVSCLLFDQLMRAFAAGSSSLCRTCYFDTELYKEQLEDGTSTSTGEVQLPGYVQCPCCVLEVYDKPFAQDEDGPFCKSLYTLYQRYPVVY